MTWIWPAVVVELELPEPEPEEPEEPEEPDTWSPTLMVTAVTVPAIGETIWTPVCWSVASACWADATEALSEAIWAAGVAAVWTTALFLAAASPRLAEFTWAWAWWVATVAWSFAAERAEVALETAAWSLAIWTGSGGTAFLSAARVAFADDRAAFAWEIDWAFLALVSLSDCRAVGSWRLAWLTEFFAAVLVVLIGPALSVARRAWAAMRFAWAVAICPWSAESSIVARTSPAVTTAPGATLTAAVSYTHLTLPTNREV